MENIYESKHFPYFYIFRRAEIVMYDFLKFETKNLREQYTFVGEGTLDIYIPKSFIDDGFAYYVENRMSTIGLVIFKYQNKFYKILLPIDMQFEFDSVSKFKGKIKPEIPEIEYSVYSLKRGDAFFYNANHPEDIGNAKIFFNRIIGNAKIPGYMKYSDSAKILYNLLISAGLKTKLGITSSLFEALLSQVYRNKNNLYEAYRKVAGRSSHRSEYDYRMVGIRKVPALTSIFSSITSEDITTQVANSIVRNRTGAKDFETPMERLVKY